MNVRVFYKEARGGGIQFGGNVLTANTIELQEVFRRLKTSGAEDIFDLEVSLAPKGNPKEFSPHAGIPKGEEVIFSLKHGLPDDQTQARIASHLR